MQKTTSRTVRRKSASSVSGRKWMHPAVHAAIEVLETRRLLTTLAYTGTIQTYTVPATGIYELSIGGAQGGDTSNGPQQAETGGAGAALSGDVSLTAGSVLQVVVGGEGTSNAFGVGGGGGGGSFVFVSGASQPIVVAGGGGGGAGWLGDGGNGNGAVAGGGGLGSSTFAGGSSGEATPGRFGGGGGGGYDGGGAGGGYSGGGGADIYGDGGFGGGGGGSYTADLTGLTSAVTETGNGYFDITPLPTPTITSAAQPASAYVGTTIADKATVTGGDSPTGTVTFNLYDNDTATGPALFTDTENLSGGTATSAGFPTTAAGTDYWVATYNGDSNNSSVSTVDNADPATVTGSLVVTSTSDSTTATGNTLRDAIAYANTLGAGTHAITFDPTVFATAQTITLSSTLGALTPSDTAGTITITGPSAGVTISGNNAVIVFVIDSGTVTLNNLTISHGYSDSTGSPNPSAGGIYNDGTLTVTGCTFSNDSVGGGNFGGGIYNSGTLTISGSTFSHDSTLDGGEGGGLYNDGTLIISGSTFSNNSSALGGGITEEGGSAAITNCTFYDNQASNSGGGIFGNSFTLVDSTLTDNSAVNDGGGIYAESNPTLGDTIVAGNTSGDPSSSDIFGGVRSMGNNLIGNGDGSGGLTNGVNGDVVGTTASPINPLLGTLGYYGGATQTVPLLPGSPAIGAGNTTSGVSTVEQITVSGNSGGFVVLDFGGQYTTVGYASAITATGLQSSLYNLVTTVSAGADVGVQPESDQNQIYVFDVTLGGTLAGEAEPLFTVANEQNMTVSISSLAAGGPPTTDQTGYTRSTTAPSIGAYENEGFTLTADPTAASQSATTSAQFADPLKVTVASNNALLTDLAGGVITYSAPTDTTQPTATLSSTTATIQSDNTASITAAADAIAGGPYTVAASASGVATAADFSLTNNAVGSLVVNTTGDPSTPVNGENSLREAIAYANSLGGNQTITFASNVTGTITLAGTELELSDSTGKITIDGPGASLLSVSGAGTSRVFLVDPGTTAEIDGLTITDGNSSGQAGINGYGNSLGGGIDSLGTLTVSNCVVSNNQGPYSGEGIASTDYANFTVIDSTLSGNSVGGDGAAEGGGIDSQGTLSLQGSSVTGNSATSDGGGIFGYQGSITITESTLSGNSSGYGGGIASFNGTTVLLINSTLSRNTASLYGGAFVALGSSSPRLTATNSTIAGNIAPNGAGIVGSATLNNSIVADSAYNPNPNYYTFAFSGSNNLLVAGATQGLTNGINGNIVVATASAMDLGALGNYGGSTQTIPLLPGGPTIGTGIPITGITIDQTGYTRSTTTPSIGAYENEGFTISTDGGTRNQLRMAVPSPWHWVCR